MFATHTPSDWTLCRSVVFAAVVAAAVAGCSRKVRYTGVIFTTHKSGLESLLDYRIIRELKAGEEPVSDAIVYLSEDPEGHKPVAGFMAKTDKRGRYQIDSQWPPSGYPRGTTFYIVVKKDGFAPCRFTHFTNGTSPDRDDAVEMLHPVE